MVFLNIETAETRPARCARNSCSYCLVKNAHRRALAVALAQPTRELRFSLVAEAGDATPWSTARRRVNKTVELMRSWGEDPGQLFYVVEPNPEGTGYHAHGMQHGSKRINKDALDQASFRAGSGLTRVRKIKNVGSLADYGLKGVALANYGLKGAQDGQEFLALNGGRLGHFTRGFFRSDQGDRLPVRAAERQAMAVAYGKQGKGTWTLVTVAGAKSWASLTPRRSRALETPPLGTLTAG